MAGSWNHIVTDKGKFRGVELLDHMGDAYEALEECYGMMHILANEIAKESGSASLIGKKSAALMAIEHARLRYREGIDMSPGFAKGATRF